MIIVEDAAANDDDDDGNVCFLFQLYGSVISKEPATVSKVSQTILKKIMAALQHMFLISFFFFVNIWINQLL